MTTQQPEALRVASWLITAPQKTTIGDMLLAGRELRRLHARIVELEAQLAEATNPTQLGLEKDAARYQWLRERDLETVHKGGVFAGMTPENYVLNGADLDAAIDDALAAQAKQGGIA